MTTLCLDSHRQSVSQLINRLASVCPGFAEPRSRSELASNNRCMKFCDDTPSAVTLLTLKNPRGLDPDYLLYFEYKVSKTHVSLSNSIKLWGYWRFVQIRQRPFYCADMQIMHFILDKILTYHTPFHQCYSWWREWLYDMFANQYDELYSCVA